MAEFYSPVPEVPDTGFTHGGKFHADDVFATAFLRLLNPDIYITRGFQVPEAFDGIIYDIGRGRYDHHQTDKEIRANGCPYAAFGLLWRDFGAKWIGEKEATRFDEEFIQPLDRSDNTGCAQMLADIISDFNPSWDSDAGYDAAFWEAEAFAEHILRRHFDALAGIYRGKDLVRQAMKDSDGNILVLPRYAPWKGEAVGSGYQVVVYPSNRGGYGVQGVPIRTGDTALVCSMPQDWWGKSPEELADLSGIPSLHFCHASGFLAATDTKEDALLAAQAALAAKGNQ